MLRPKTILWVDDEIETLDSQVLFLEQQGFAVERATNGDDALVMLRRQSYGVVLLDEQMPGTRGLDLVPALREIDAAMPVVMVTKSEEPATMRDAIGAEIADYLIKPVNPRQVLTVVTRLLEGDRIRQQRLSRDFVNRFRELEARRGEVLEWREWVELIAELAEWDDETLATLLGGMRSLSMSQIAQFAVLLTASLAAIIVVLWETGTMASAQTLVLGEAIPTLGFDIFAQTNVVSRFALIFCLAAGTASLPFLLMRSFTTPSAGGARASFFASAVFAGVLCLAAPAFAALFEAASVQAGSVLSMIAEALLSVAAITGLLAVGSALALSIANALSYDLYYKSLQPIASTRRRIFVARLSVIIVTGLAAIPALAASEETLIATSAALSLAASAFLPALVLGVWWKRATADAALAGMVAGLLLCLYYMVAPHVIPFAFYESSSFFSNASDAQVSAYEALRHSYYVADAAAQDAVLVDWEKAALTVANWWGLHGVFAALFAVPVGFIVIIGVSLFTRAPSDDVRRFVKSLRAGTA